MKKKVLYAVKNDWFPTLFSKRDLDRIKNMTDVLDVDIPADADKYFLLQNISRADIVITSWDTANLDADVIAKAENLKLLTHAAGSVKPVVSDALWNKNIKVTSAATAISYGVAEFCLGLILLAPKRTFWTAEGTRKGLWQEELKAFNGPFEIYQQKIGIIGAGHIGRYLAKLLKNFTCDVLIYDPYCSAEDAEKLGAKKVQTLDELFSQCIAVSLNAPSTEETKGMIRGSHFQKLPDGALFINTARPAIINHAEMVEELSKKRFIACIDVTEPEPALHDEPLRSLPNVILTPHIAGVAAQNRLRIGTFVADEIEAFINGNKLHFEVTPEDLKKIG